MLLIKKDKETGVGIHCSKKKVVSELTFKYCIYYNNYYESCELPYGYCIFMQYG